MKKISLLLLLTLSSCAGVYKNRPYREIQTEIIHKIREIAPKLGECVKNSDVYSTLGVERVRIVAEIHINPNGQLDQFKLDQNIYPQSLGECFYKNLDQIEYPKFKEYDLIQIDQPFIFSN